MFKGNLIQPKELQKQTQISIAISFIIGVLAGIASEEYMIYAVSAVILLFLLLLILSIRNSKSLTQKKSGEITISEVEVKITDPNGISTIPISAVRHIKMGTNPTKQKLSIKDYWNLLVGRPNLPYVIYSDNKGNHKIHFMIPSDFMYNQLMRLVDEKSLHLSVD